MVESIQTSNIQLLNQITKKAGIEQKSTDAPSSVSEGRVPDEVSLSTQSEQNTKQLEYLDRQLTKFSEFLSGEGVAGDGIIPEDAPFKPSAALDRSQIGTIKDISQKSVSLQNEEDVAAILGSVQNSLTDESISLISSQNRNSFTQFIS